MRKGKWKLHEYFEDGAFELYNLEKDPGERDNLVKKEKVVFIELKSELYAWRKRYQMPVPIALNPKYKGDR